MRPLLTLTLVVFGCRNECQQLCVDMADFAEEDCNKEFSDNQVDACLEKYNKKSVSDDRLDTCAEYGPRLREEWNCEDVNEYFD